MTRGEFPMQLTEGKISTRQLKQFAVEKLPHGSVLRDVVTAETDDLSVSEFLAKLPIWLLLLRRTSER